VARDFEQIQASIGNLLAERPRWNILRRGSAGGAVWPARWSWSWMQAALSGGSVEKSLDLRELGRLQIARASHVEPDRDGLWGAS